MIWFANVTKRDARLLASWWNSHTYRGRYFVRKAFNEKFYKRAKYDVVREE